MEVRVHVRKTLIFVVRTCYRSACDHPFVVGIGFFFFFLYRYFPGLFAFLVSSSPVIICTAVLLGALLSFGEPNIPEIDEEEEEVDDEKTRETHHETDLVLRLLQCLKPQPESPFQSHWVSNLHPYNHPEILLSETGGVVEGDLVVEKDGNFSVETHVENNENVVVDEKDSGFSAEISDRSFAVEGDRNGDHHERGLYEKREITEDERELYEKREITEDERELYEKKEITEDERELYENSLYEKREITEDERELYEKSLYEKTPLIGEDGGEKEIEGVHVENSRPESELPGTYLEDPFGASSWKQIKDQDESSDSESDGGESSSPDASMADILPMLDELHPLLDTEVPQPALVSPGESDDALESSSGSDDESSEENEEVENRVEEEDNDDEEEDQQGRKDDGAKPVVTWTEDDEKNLMDLGNSELERNRRLESLIARRRARKSMRAMVIEKNLIDFNGPPFQITPISTARRNPFDLHYDSNEGLGLPPIPGSAPSVMAPRRNPFDLPYGPSEERPNLSGGSFEEEFLTGHDKDMYFRRHESFNMGSSYLGESSKHDFQFRPYFTTEQASPERMGYHSFHRQLSDISYSKISSVSDTESVSSTVENDSQMNVIEPELSQEGKMIHHTDHVSHHDKPESLSSTVLDNQRNFVEQELSQDGELLDHDDHSRPHDKPESPSSLEVVIGDRDQGDSDADDEIYPERDFILPDTESMTNAYMKPEVLEERHSGSSSSSSMDSGDENRFEEQTRDKTSKDCHNSVQPSTVDSDVRDSIEEVDDSKTKEPVYDRSLLEIEKSISGISIIKESLSFKNQEVHTSTSSVAFDMHVDGKSSTHDGDTEKVTTANNEGQWVASSELCTVEENEMHSKEVAMISEEDVMKVGFSEDDQKSDKHTASTLSSVDEPAPSDSVSSSSETESEDERELTEVHHEQDLIPTSSSHLVHAGSPRFDIEESDSKVSDSGVSFEDLVHLESEQPPPFHSDHEEIQKPSSYLVLSTNGTNAVDLVEEIKEIDERLLTELDVVGDFSVEESRASTEEIEEQLATEVQQSLPQLQVLEANSTEGVKYDSQILVKPEALLEPQHPLESWAICSDFELGKSSSELQGLDANSNEDVDQTFNQLEKVESSIDEREEPEPEPKETEGGNAQFHLLNHDPIPMKTVLELPVAETRSLAVIDFTFEKLHEGESESRIAIEPEHHERILEETHESNKVNLHSEVPILIETKSELQVLEARSLQDIDSVFKQFHQDEVEKLTPLESTQDELTLEETEVRFTDLEMPNQDQNPIETNLELPVLEARSLEDIEAVLKNFNGEEIQKPKVESIHKESSFEETQAGSSKFEVPSQYTESAFTHSHEEEIQKPAILESISKESAFEETQAGFEVPSQDIELPLKHFHEKEIQKPIVLDPIHEESMFEETQARFSKSEVPSQDLQPTEVNLGLPFLEVRLVEDTGSSLNQLQEEEAIKPVFESVTDKSTLVETTAEIAEFELTNKDAKPTETSSELPVSEARSLDDIGSTFEQVHEEVTESVVLESVHDMSKLEETRVDPAESNIQNEDQDASETVLVQPDIREEDNGVAPEQLNKGEAEKPSVLEPVEAVLKGAEVRSDENSPSVVYAGLSDSGLGHPSQEVRYLEHIDSGSQQLQKGHQEKPAHDESVEEGQGMSTLHGSVKEDYHEITVPRESSEPQVALQTDTSSQVHEAASIGDVHLSPKQLPEDEIEGLLKPTESENGSSELLMKETELTSGIRVDNEDSTAQETSTSIESEWLITEANEAPSSITTDMNKEKKKGSGKSSSSSSSSSSGSD